MDKYISAKAINPNFPYGDLSIEDTVKYLKIEAEKMFSIKEFGEPIISYPDNSFIPFVQLGFGLAKVERKSVEEIKAIYKRP